MTTYAYRNLFYLFHTAMRRNSEMFGWFAYFYSTLLSQFVETSGCRLLADGV